MKNAHKLLGKLARALLRMTKSGELEALQQANAALQISENKLAITLSSIGDAVLATDADARVILLNPVAEKLTGWTQIEASGHPVDTVFHIINEETRQLGTIPVKASLDHGTIQGLANHTILIARDGKECAIDDSCAPIRAPDGKIVGAVLIFRDISERRAMERTLETTRKELAVQKTAADEAHAFADSLIDTVRDPLLSLDQNLRVLMANRSFYEFFKAKPEETLGQMIYDLGNKQWNIPKLRELLETILPQKTSFDNFVVEHEFASIGRRTMLLNARQIQRAFGKEKIILLAIEDITDRNAWEHSFLELNERLLVSNRELEALGHSLSHDLRGPIQSIEAFSSILLEGYAEKLDAEGTQIVKSVKETAHRMYDMIFGLLSISRIARAEIRRDIIDLTTLFRMIAKEHRAAEPVRNIKVLVQENLFAQGDAKLIRMALDNLFRNAWKFTRKRTEARIEFGETYSRGKTAFFLRDNGAGFDMKHAEKIFTVFQRLHSDEEFEGTGVGLATVERIIRRHGGEIWAEGEVDKGAVFYFTLK